MIEGLIAEAKEQATWDIPESTQILLLKMAAALEQGNCVEVKHAHYEIVPNQTKKQAVPDVRCSNCQRVLKHKKENYCSHCGARLEG